MLINRMIAQSIYAFSYCYCTPDPVQVHGPPVPNADKSACQIVCVPESEPPICHQRQRGAVLTAALS